jgi:agmatinase
MIYDNFLGLPPEQSDFDRAGVLILPLPMEATVSYGGGTGDGPAAIIAASCQVELYDREFDSEPATHYGIHTLPALNLPQDAAAAVAQIAQAAATALSTGKLLVGLGGEHTVSVGMGRGILQAVDGPLTVVQIDAHSDLRDSYEDSPYSHACIARRLLEDPRVEQVLQLGIRSVCTEEVDVARSNPERVRVWYAEEVHAGGWQQELAERTAGRTIFLTMDVDGLDPSVIPATGTPEPGGLSWWQTLEILRTVASAGTIVALDCVELAPSPGLHMADFAAAKLVYKAITYAQAASSLP